MRYIRMQNGIRNITGFVDKGLYWQNPNCGLDYIGKEQIIKQADTIEELCDEFDYYFDKDFPHNRCYKEVVLDKWYDLDTDSPLSEKQKQSIKGAIWTEKGLIFVAKMNDKGELELL